MVLINVQDPAAADSTSDVVSLELPSSYRHGKEVTLRSSAPEGLASSDASEVSHGGRQIRPDGKATGTPVGRSMKVYGTTFTAEVEPGTAQLITLTR